MRRYRGPRKQVRIYISNEDRCEGKALWECILEKAREFGMLGATVYKGAAGMGLHTEIHTFNIWSISQNNPVIIEMIDSAEKIEAFLGLIDPVIDEGLITLSDVDVISYKHPKGVKA